MKNNNNNNEYGIGRNIDDQQTNLYLLENGCVDKIWIASEKCWKEADGCPFQGEWVEQVSESKAKEIWTMIPNPWRLGW